jgi:putative FmdB family regulatory protein
MPIFEYRCNDCTSDFEVLQRTSDADKSTKCPRCGAQNVIKRFSTFATAGSQKETAGDNGA